MTGHGEGRYNGGKALVLKSDEFLPADIDVEVTFIPYVPIDQVALLNAGILGNRDLKMPLGRRILEDIGIEETLTRRLKSGSRNDRKRPPLL